MTENETKSNDEYSDGIVRVGNEKECRNCGLEFPKRPVSVGITGLKSCPNCGEPTALGRSVDTGTNQGEN